MTSNCLKISVIYIFTSNVSLPFGHLLCRGRSYQYFLGKVQLGPRMFLLSDVKYLVVRKGCSPYTIKNVFRAT